MRPVAQDAIQSAGLEEELSAVLQIIVKRYFCYHGIDANLQWQDVDLVQHCLDRTHLPLSAVQQDCIILVIGNNAQSVWVRFGAAALQRPQQRIGTRRRRLLLTWWIQVKTRSRM